MSSNDRSRGARIGERRCPAHWQKRRTDVGDERRARDNPADERAADRPSRAPAPPRHLARNLVSLRHTRSLTQDGLAKAAAVPRSTIANLESGDGNPSLAVLVKVAGALGVPIDELLASPRAMVRRWPAAEVAHAQQGPRRDASARWCPSRCPTR